MTNKHLYCKKYIFCSKEIFIFPQNILIKLRKDCIYFLNNIFLLTVIYVSTNKRKIFLAREIFFSITKNFYLAYKDIYLLIKQYIIID